MSRRSSKRLKGGNANTFPMEYFGGVSGNYNSDAGGGGSGAYGDFVAQSFGEPFNDTGTGPNMFVHPNGSGSQTGGSRRRRTSRTSRTSRNSRNKRTSRTSRNKRTSRTRRTSRTSRTRRT